MVNLGEKLKEAEEEGKGSPMGRPAVLTDLNSRDLSDTEPPSRQHTPADKRPPMHIKHRTAWSGLSGRGCT